MSPEQLAEIRARWVTVVEGSVAEVAQPDVLALLGEVERLIGEDEAVGAVLGDALRERDEARAEVERLKKTLRAVDATAAPYEWIGARYWTNGLSRDALVRDVAATVRAAVLAERDALAALVRICSRGNDTVSVERLLEAIGERPAP